MKWHRLRRRLWKHHVPLVLISAAITTSVYGLLDADDVRFKLSMGTAYAGLVLLAATLIIGPWNVLRDKPNPVSFDLRRDIGIWAGLVSLIHVVVGLQVHLRGEMWLYFVPRGLEFPYIRTNLFGGANYAGLLATLIITMLLVLSNDLSLRRLGTKQWKSLHRWIYAGFGLVVLHGIAYMAVENRDLPYIIIFVSICAVVLAGQLAGLWQQTHE